MRLVLLGAPGAGKGTQAVILSEKLKVPHISTGDIFRSNIKGGTQLGVKAKGYIDKGMLVPDEITIGIVEDRIKKDDCRNGFILDGFPRNIYQAEKLDNILKDMGLSLDAVFNIEVAEDTIIARMSGRRTCTSCGMSYHTVFNSPKVEGKCDICGADLIQREDDKEETVIMRLKTYHEQTEPLIQYYSKQGKLVTVQGQEKIEDTTKKVLEALGADR